MRTSLSGIASLRAFAPLAFAGVLFATPAAHATSYSVVYTFPNTNALAPQIGAVQNGTIYGTDPAGGANGVGVLFTIKGNTYAPLYTFSYGGGPGVTPNSRLILDGAGGVIGTTLASGGAATGSIFHISAQGTVLWSHTFNSPTDGQNPMDGLAAGALGTFYGTTSGGAIAPGDGTLFRVTQTGAFKVLYYFRSTPVDGHCPYSGVAVGPTGIIYGASVGNGFGGQPIGALWERLPNGNPTVIYSFTNGDDGEFPEITPSLDASGNVWGTTYTQNGGNFAGALWRYTTSGPSKGFAVIHDFSGGADGYFPNSQLLLAKDGNLWGTTLNGGGAAGTSGLGVVFKISPTAAPGTVPTVVHTFAGGSDGGNPVGNLVMDTAGNIYGGTSAGTIYKITP